MFLNPFSLNSFLTMSSKRKELLNGRKAIRRESWQGNSALTYGSTLVSSFANDLRQKEGYRPESENAIVSFTAQ